MGTILTSLSNNNYERRLVSRNDLLPLIILVSAVTIFFFPVIIGQAWIPAGGGDLVSFLFPNYRFAAASLHKGELPLWNPYLYAGSPFISDNQSGVFYPVNLLLFVLNPDFGYGTIEGLVILHILLAGIFMYFCLRWFNREQPLSRIAAVFGALAFMFSGVFITHLGNLNLIAVLAWLPLIFICLHRAILANDSRERGAWAVAGGTTLGVSTLAGHGQMTFMIAGFLVLYALLMALLYRKWLAIPSVVLLALVGLATAAIALIPAYRFMGLTVRAEFDPGFTGDYSLPWAGLTGLAAPDFYGRGIYRFWGSWSRVEYGYLGILPWLLAIVAVILRPGKRVFLFASTALLFLLLALGPNTPLYLLLTRIVPIFPFQAPARFVALVGFCIAILAALGLDLLSQDSRTAQRRTIFLVMAGLVFAAVLLLLFRQINRVDNPSPEQADQMRRAILVFTILAVCGCALILARYQGWLSSPIFGALSITILAIDLIGLGHAVEIDRNDPGLGYPEDSQALSYLQDDLGIHRMEITGEWQPNLPQMESIFSMGGVFNPLALANYSVYQGSVGYRGSPLYNLLGVKYIVASKDNPPGDTNFLVPVYIDDPRVDVYLNTLALPRVMLIYQSSIVPDHDAAFDAIHQDIFDPTVTVVLEGGQELIQQHGSGTISITRYDLNEASFEVSTDSPAYLLLTDIFHPDWQVFVDGEQANIEVADYAFRAVYLPPGQHNVRFQFVPSGWSTGLVISILAWLVVGLYAFWSRRSPPAI